jgi:two-component system, LytTR family, sensor kinase
LCFPDKKVTNQHPLLIVEYFNGMINIDNNKFIFSDEKKYRFSRHMLFWTAWGLWFFLPRELSPTFLQKYGHFPNVIKSMAETAILLLSQPVLVYSLLYFILPRYVFTGRYIKASLCIVALLLLIIFVNIVLQTIPWHEVFRFLPSEYRPFPLGGSFKITTNAWLGAMLGSLTIAAFAASFKIYKYYYVKHMRNRQLMKENMEAQLRLLRAQVHPHFLFNTLNNIYSQTQLESPKGSKMIMGLSDMLRYILYQGQKPLVPLKQELMMVTEYISLEKIRYGNKLDVYVMIPDKADDLYIAPLLLLPFVENCFKHGASNILQNPWINLTVEVKDTILTMKLMNGKAPVKENEQNKAGIGISNVRQRLELLYKNKYDLQIREDEEMFVVDLKVELIRTEILKEKEAASLLNEMIYT